MILDYDVDYFSIDFIAMVQLDELKASGAAGCQYVTRYLDWFHGTSLSGLRIGV